MRPVCRPLPPLRVPLQIRCSVNATGRKMVLINRTQVLGGAVRWGLRPAGDPMYPCSDTGLAVECTLTNVTLYARPTALPNRPVVS